MGRSTQHLDAEVRDIRELDRVVLRGADRFGEVLANLVGINVEGGHEFDVANAVSAEIVVHEAGNLVFVLGVLVILDTLHQ